MGGGNEKILKTDWGDKNTLYLQSLNKLRPFFSTEAMEVRRQKNDTFEVMGGKKLHQLRLLYLEFSNGFF